MRKISLFITFVFVSLLSYAQVDAGMVSTSNGNEQVNACTGSSTLMFSVQNTSTSTDAYAYVITNDQGDILGFPPSNNIDITGAPAGKCYVYGFSYTGLLDSTETVIWDLTSDGEYELSSNWVTVTRGEASAGSVNTNGETSVTAEAGEASLDFMVSNDGAVLENTSYAYVITTDKGDILGFPPSNEIKISGAPVGTCYVYGFSYTGTLDSTATTIESLTSDGCYELSSNWITVTRTVVTGFTKSFNGSALSIFPSIAEETITIEGFNDVSSISIMTSEGHEVLSSVDSIINVEELTSGAYIVRVVTANDISVGRFIKK